MTSHEYDSPSDEGTKSVIWSSLLFLGIGYLLGGGIEGSREEQAALDWAVQMTKSCEAPDVRKNFSSVADCLKRVMAKADEERREEMRGEDYDPRG